ATLSAPRAGIVRHPVPQPHVESEAHVRDLTLVTVGCPSTRASCRVSGSAGGPECAHVGLQRGDRIKGSPLARPSRRPRIVDAFQTLLILRDPLKAATTGELGRRSPN